MVKWKTYDRPGCWIVWSINIYWNSDWGGKNSTALIGMKEQDKTSQQWEFLNWQMLIAVISMWKGWDGNGGCSCIIYINKVRQCLYAWIRRCIHACTCELLVTPKILRRCMTTALRSSLGTLLCRHGIGSVKSCWCYSICNVTGLEEMKK